MSDGFFMNQLSSLLDDSLFTITTQKQDAVVNNFTVWLTEWAHLKPLPDLQQRIQETLLKLPQMAKNLDVSLKEGKLVIKSDAESEVLLNSFRRGSDWFDPHPDVNAAILASLFAGSKRK